jgi:hypothetical protein
MSQERMGIRITSRTLDDRPPALCTSAIKKMIHQLALCWHYRVTCNYDEITIRDSLTKAQINATEA